MQQKSWAIKRVANSAKKSLERYNLKIQKQILVKMECLEYDPFVCDIRKVQGRNDDIYRMRVDDYRVYFRLLHREKFIEILLIGHRSSIKEKTIQRL
jgi:mRNA interferase RelE/StbE